MKKLAAEKGVYLLVFLTCLFLSPSTPSTSDGVNFLLSLTDFDIDRFQPHFPGYPLYIIFSKLFVMVGASSETALMLTNACSATFFFYVLKQFNSCTPLVLLFAFLSVPLLFTKGLIFGSDMLGVALWAYLVRLTWKMNFDFKHTMAIALVSALLMGVRLGYAPLLSVLVLPLIHSPDKLKTLSALLVGFCIGLALWLVPLTSLIGLEHYISIGQTFIQGHFTSWGGSAVTETDPFVRLKKINLILFRQVLIILPLLYSFVYSIKKQKINYLFWTLCLLPYFIFVLVGQNLNNARHFLPFVLPVILLLGQLENYLKPHLVYVLFVFLAFFNFKQQWQHHHQTPLPLQIVNYLEKQKNIERANIYAGETHRFIEWKQPYWSSKKEINFNELPYNFLQTSNNTNNYYISTQDLEKKFPKQVSALIYFSSDQQTVGVFKEK